LCASAGGVTLGTLQPRKNAAGIFNINQLDNWHTK